MGFFYYPWMNFTMIILIPGIIFAMYAQGKVKTTFNRYQRVASSKGFSGAQVARQVLDANGLYDVPIEMIRGNLSDHYDPRKKVLRLSQEVYSGRSIASIGVAAHEVGHAIQHQTGYAPLMIRNTIAPVASFGSQIAWFLFIIGFLFSNPSMMDIGILFFTTAVFFQIVTLPVEFNASNRAIDQLKSHIYIGGNEAVGVKKVLDAAALTYVAATVMALLQLLRLIILRGSRD